MEDKLKLAMKVYRLSEAWTLESVLQQLVKATDILLKDKGYDGNTYEEMQYCSEVAKELIIEIPTILSAMAEKVKVIDDQADVIKSVCVCDAKGFAGLKPNGNCGWCDKPRE